MQISEIRIKLVGNRTDRLKAFCSVTFDNDFVVRDLKIIEGAGGYFVAMPSRKLTDRCPSCGSKNHLRAKFCGDCGGHLNENRANRGSDGRTKLHADVAHPVNSQAREAIQTAIVEAYHEEVERSKQPGYRPTELGDDYEDMYPHHDHDHDDGKPSHESSRPEQLAEDSVADNEDDEEDDDDGHSGLSSFGEGLL